MKIVYKRDLYFLLSLILIISAIFSSCSSAVPRDTSELGNYNSVQSKNDFDGSISSIPYESNAQSASSNETFPGQKIIKTSEIQAETKDFETAVTSIKSKVIESGGYTESETLKNNSTYQYNSKHSSGRTLTAVFRIPSEKLQEFTDGLSSSVGIIYLNTNVKEVSDEYYDIEAKLQTLKTERDSLLQMMSSLDTSKDYNFWYELHNRITEIEKEIASYEASIRNLDNKISYSTVSLVLNEVLEYSVTEEPAFFERIGNAFNDSWKNFANGWANFAVGFVRAIPTLLLLGVVTVVGVFIIRALIIKSKNKKAKKLSSPDVSLQQGQNNNK